MTLMRDASFLRATAILGTFLNKKVVVMTEEQPSLITMWRRKAARIVWRIVGCTCLPLWKFYKTNSRR